MLSQLHLLLLVPSPVSLNLKRAPRFKLQALHLTMASTPFPLTSPQPFSQIQVVEPFTTELAGQDLEIFQLGRHTRLNAFNDLENVLVTGSLANDGTYVIAPQGVSPSTLFFQPGTLFVPEASGAQVSIAKDLDNDGLPDGSEYHYNSNPNFLTPTVMAILIWPKFKVTSAAAILQS